MDTELLRVIIRDKLKNGVLPHDSIPRIWGGPGQEERCDACEELVAKRQMLMEGLSDDGHGIQMHVQCFYVWDNERQAIGHTPSEPTGSGL